MYTGRGKYGKNWIRNAAGTVGTLLKRKKFGSDLYDATAGAAFDSAAMMGAGLYTGQGDYIPEANGLIQSSKSTMDVVPLFTKDTDLGVQISKREYVAEIFGPPAPGGVTAPFVLQSYAINPGLERTFPWLSQIAANYDEYTMDQLIFTFKSTTTESGNQQNGQVGTVIMATNYNAAAPAFTEKFTMMQYDKANSTRLTESLQHGVECDPSKLSGSHGEYVRVNPVISNQDLKSYDHGLFQIAVANCTSNLQNQSLGELWVSYSVTLRKPKFFTGKGLAISKDIFISYPSGSERAAAVMGTGQLRGQQNNIGILCANSTVNNSVDLTFPAAFAGNLRLMVSADYRSMYSVNVDPFVVVTGNITVIPDLYGGGTNVADSPQSQVYNRLAANGVSAPATIGFVAVAHIQIQIASNGANNVLRVTMPPETTQLGTDPREQCYIECSEYNAGFSYAANNISSNLAPIWIDGISGIITIP